MTTIEDYALIGDCETAALVSRDGSIDWLCWPRFDSAACYAALLGERSNGHWQIFPRGAYRVERKYRRDTLILETEFRTESGDVTLIDFMPIRGRASDIVRMVVGHRGRVELQSKHLQRFDYGAVIPWVHQAPDGTLTAVAGPSKTVLRSNLPQALSLEPTSTFTVDAGQTVSFVLTYTDSHLPNPDAIDAHQALSDTETYWHDWIAQCTYHGAYPEAVRRSLITLKALTYAPTGGVVAAVTTSLPEWIGGERNWDYRYCWVRDATLTLLALLDCGFREEAVAWRDWLLRAVAGSPEKLQVMYGVAGERRLAESTLDWLSGYEGSKPVRIGNGAADQLQLDVFGEVMDVFHQARCGGLAPSREGWKLQRALVEHLTNVWEQPDEGLWEVRGPRQHFTHSKVMAWVALDRTVRGAEQFGLEGPIDQWRALRSRIHREVCERAFDKQLGSFTQAYGNQTLDASVLMIPLVGFLPATDERMVGTVKAIEQSLLVDGFVQRYDTRATADGLLPGEGAFLACSFWLADNYLLQGRRSEATRLFEALLQLRNDVGLLAEEYDPIARRQLGNYPQAFSHLSLIGTALNLARGAKPMEQRPSAAPPPGVFGST